MLNISTQGVRLLKSLEGEKLEPYKDSGGKWTIGVGHLIKNNEGHLMQGITSEVSTALLTKDIAEVALMLTDSIKVNLSQSQVDALIILGFNIGVNALKNSELLALINRSADLEDIKKRWVSHYITAAGVPSTGLKKRREFEANLFTQKAVKNSDGKNNSLNYLTIATFIALLYATTKK